ncbi:hypothetical protein [Actinoplanes sp. URMC 104]|uniref:Mom family adenine methylcarbamoylation protein n=1 Tax=Actinoplanes sp. URMC 104 TaxID=3423409 RepID=UPI003F1C5236
MRSATTTPTLFDGLCQRWHNGLQAWQHTDDDHFQPHRYTVVPLDEDTARQFTTTHHYSRAWPAARLRYGLIEDGERLVGACVLGIPMSPAVLTNPFPAFEPYAQSLELSRLVLLDRVAANAESWFVRRVFRAAAGEGVRGIVAYADPMPRVDEHGAEFMPGHHGICYQGTGGVYFGRGRARTLTMLPGGVVLNDRTQSKIRKGETGAAAAIARLVDLGAAPKPAWMPGSVWLPAALERVGATEVKHPGNHRYGWSIGPRWSRRVFPVAMPALPYPRRGDLGLAA